MNFADRLDKAIADRRLSNQGAADLARVVGREGIRSWRSGESQPSVDEAITLAAALGVSPEWLLLGKEEDLPRDERFVVDAYRAGKSLGLSAHEAVMAIGAAADRKRLSHETQVLRSRDRGIHPDQDAAVE